MNTSLLILGTLAVATIVCAIRSRKPTAPAYWQFSAIACSLLCIIVAIINTFISSEESAADADRRDAAFDDYALQAFADSCLAPVSKRPLRIVLYEGFKTDTTEQDQKEQDKRMKRLTQLLSGPGQSCKRLRLESEPEPDQLETLFQPYDLVIITDCMTSHFLATLTSLAQTEDGAVPSSPRFALLFHPYSANQLNPLLPSGRIITCLSRRSSIDKSLAMPKSKEEAIQRRYLIFSPGGQHSDK